MISELSTAMASIKTASELAALVLKIKVDSAVTQKAIELQTALITQQSAMLSIQAQYQTMLQENDDLKKQLMNIEDWAAETAKYQLTEISPSMFVYAFKPDQHSAEPNHWLCPTCYQKRVKSILQFSHLGVRGTDYKCNNCQTIITDAKHKAPSVRMDSYDDQWS